MSTCTAQPVDLTAADTPESENDALSASAESFSRLAWAGWQMAIPREWQPLKITGTPEKGQVVVGNAECAIYMLKWERAKRPPAAHGRGWLEERFKKLAVHPDKNPPLQNRFTACGWAHEIQTEEGKKTTHWYGYAEPANLFLGITVNGVLSRELRTTVVEQVLPTLVTTATDQASVWAMYDVSFTVPAGFQLAHKHLFSGDVALAFIRGKRESLLVRQVYPGALALERKSFNKWFNSYPFKQHRRFRRSGMETRDWQHPSRPALAGKQRFAKKRLPVPLGFCGPRRVHAVAVHDQTLDRLYLVEHMVKGMPDTSVCMAALAGMNTAAGEKA